MDDKELFLRTLDDLHRSINANDPYEVLKASGLIRQLFLDGANSLVDKIGRQYRHRHELQFEIVEQTPPRIPGLNPHVWCAIDGIDPRRVPLHLPRVYKNRDRFLSTTVAVIENDEYSIRDLVKFAANIMGGIHSGMAKTEKQRKLAQLQSLYVFSNLPVALLFIRSIGRLILEALKPLASKVRGLERFENRPGVSIHIALVLFPTEDTENYILDIGTDRRRNRISVFLDSRGELTLRVYDSDRRTRLARAGVADCAYRYGERTYLSLEVAVGEREALLATEAGGWSYYDIAPRAGFDHRGDRFHFVLGSDVAGTKETHMGLLEQCVYSRSLKKDAREKLRRYFEDQVRKGYKGQVLFKGNQFLHSQEHPNFPQKA